MSLYMSVCHISVYVQILYDALRMVLQPFCVPKDGEKWVTRGEMGSPMVTEKKILDASAAKKEGDLSLFTSISKVAQHRKRLLQGQLILLVIFLPYFTRETNAVCFPEHQSTSEKGSTLKEFAPTSVCVWRGRGANSFILG